MFVEYEAHRGATRTPNAFIGFDLTKVHSYSRSENDVMIVNGNNFSYTIRIDEEQFQIFKQYLKTATRLRKMYE